MTKAEWRKSTSSQSYYKTKKKWKRKTQECIHEQRMMNDERWMTNDEQWIRSLLHNNYRHLEQNNTFAIKPMLGWTAPIKWMKDSTKWNALVHQVNDEG